VYADNCLFILDVSRDFGPIINDKDLFLLDFCMVTYKDGISEIVKNKYGDVGVVVNKQIGIYMKKIQTIKL
jgi:hypothetical protein